MECTGRVIVRDAAGDKAAAPDTAAWAELIRPCKRKNKFADAPRETRKAVHCQSITTCLRIIDEAVSNQ